MKSDGGRVRADTAKNENADTADARRFSQIILILSFLICADQFFLRHPRSIIFFLNRAVAISPTANREIASSLNASQ